MVFLYLLFLTHLNVVQIESMLCRNAGVTSYEKTGGIGGLANLHGNMMPFLGCSRRRGYIEVGIGCNEAGTDVGIFVIVLVQFNLFVINIHFLNDTAVIYIDIQFVVEVGHESDVKLY